MGKSLAPAVQFPLRSSDLAFPVNQTARNDLETVRYYERRSLLPKPPRSASGYRLFAMEATQRLRFTQRAKETGFLCPRDRGIVIAASVTKDNECRHRAKAETKIADIQNRIKSRESMERTLLKLTKSCSGCEPIAECPILESLDEGT